MQFVQRGKQKSILLPQGRERPPPPSPAARDAQRERGFGRARAACCGRAVSYRWRETAIIAPAENLTAQVAVNGLKGGEATLSFENSQDERTRSRRKTLYKVHVHALSSQPLLLRPCETVPEQKGPRLRAAPAERRGGTRGPMCRAEQSSVSLGAPGLDGEFLSGVVEWRGPSKRSGLSLNLRAQRNRHSPGSEVKMNHWPAPPGLSQPCVDRG
ncbi:hypothetical protein SKAU_G00251770 [Synaphobranchus kaupii]|uniref:Uncharacterized protein n=1 Tax=Synaphobranchus kaupii TaxID=118154 RepID=A0A9Q1IRZ2_SYNKA|nr:hypothetical protein SKAU_G00251770 [Synaphobranchus kaupii]